MHHSFMVANRGTQNLHRVRGSFHSSRVLVFDYLLQMNQLATRGGICFATITVAGSANGLLTYVVLENLNHVGGWLACRGVFFIEGKSLSPLPPHVVSTGLIVTKGLMSVGFGVVVLALLPASPERLGWFFTAAEKDIARRRYQEAFNIHGTGVRPAQILKVLRDPKIWF